MNYVAFTVQCEYPDLIRRIPREIEKIDMIVFESSIRVHGIYSRALALALRNQARAITGGGDSDGHYAIQEPP